MYLHFANVFLMIYCKTC